MQPDDSDLMESDEEDDEDEPMSDREQTQTMTYRHASHSAQPVRPLIQVVKRLFFAVFSQDEPLPSPEELNRNNGTGSAVFAVQPSHTFGAHVMRAAEDAAASSNSLSSRKVHGWAPDGVPQKLHWFCIDPDMMADEEKRFDYMSFWDDWGPLNMANVYQFCAEVQEMMELRSLRDHAIVIYTSSDPRKKANAATLAALRSVLAERMSPADAFHPFADVSLQLITGRSSAVR